MNKNTFSLITILLLSSTSIIAQEEEPKFGIKLSGFVKNDFFYDSRQTSAAREGHFLFWPLAEAPDEYGNDMNAKSNFNFLAIQSRLSGAITGPDAFGAKTSGLIEGDFFAQANDNINLFRLRHAFIKLKWANTEVITGQYWNPLFVTGCFPGTVSFNTGTPLQSFARNPQVRVTQWFGNIQFIGAALGQRDYASIGPASANGSSEYLRNSSIPDLHFQVHYNIKNDASGTDILLGAGAAYKTIVPRIKSVIGDTASYQVNEKVSGLTAIAFTKITLAPVTIKLQGRYGENISDVLSISGFAIRKTTNTITGESDYTPLQNITLWGEVHTNGKILQVGVFGGYLKNMGTKKEMSSASNKIYGFGTNIESLFRISPRLIVTSNKFKIATELEYTSVAFGSNYDANYIPATSKSVSNIRVLVSTIYSF